MTGRRDEADEIEITEEMIRAGLAEYSWRWSDLADLVEGADCNMLAAVYIAMFRHRPKVSDEAL